MSQIRVRLATEHDVPAIERLQQQWSAEDITYGFVPEGEEQIRQQLGPFLLVAEVDDTVVGFISGSRRISDGMAVAPEGVAYLEIDNLYVLPAFRQQEIGGNLLNALLTVGKAEGVRKVLLYSATKDLHRMLAFYERHGFQPWYVQMFRDL